MSDIFKGVLTLVVGSIFTLSGAQIYAPTYSGSFRIDNHPYQGGPIIWLSKGKLSAGGAEPSASTATLSPEPHGVGTTDGRTMLKFKADGSGDVAAANWKLPTGGDGSTSSAQKGEERIFSTWTPSWCIAPANSHAFHSEVSLSSLTSTAWVDIDVQEAPRPFQIGSSGEFTHSFLDNGGYDANPQSGQTVIDKWSSPTVGLDFSLPSFEMRRDVVHWQDGTPSPSTFYDLAVSDIWVVFDGPYNHYIYRGPNSNPIFFDPGENAQNKTIEAFNGNFNLDISQMAVGTYTVHYWAVPWTADYSNEQRQMGCASGIVAFEHMEMNVQVVPEPASATAMAGGAAALAFLRRKRGR